MHDDSRACINAPRCPGTADRIGEDTHGRPYFYCAECGTEYQTDDDEPTEADEPAPVTSIESQVYIDGGPAALRAYRRDRA